MNTKATIFFFLQIASFFFLVLSTANDYQTKSKINATTSPFKTSLSAKPAHPIPAVFAFGDSTLDAGNNDYISTSLRGDHLPYGRDFPGFPASGRFTNGRIIPDFLVSYLGIKDCIPPYLYPTLSNQDLLTGVTFASAGSGLDDLTASNANVLNMNTQLEYFQRYLSQIQNIVGSEKASQLIGNSLFLISAGTNDAVFNMYDAIISARTLQFSVPAYHDFLIQNLMTVVQHLYAMGARKFVISGLPPVGCLPIQRTVSSIHLGAGAFERVCSQQQNSDSQGYNHKLQTQIQLLQSSLHGSRIAYVDVYGPLMDMISYPSKYGFEESSRGCCGTGLLETGGLCSQSSPTCPDASRYVFWDGVHPTDTAYQVLSNFIEQTVLPHFLD